jgi:hypothetical protein
VCGNTAAAFDFLGAAVLRAALAADAERPLDLHALMDVDRLHELLTPTPSSLDTSLTTRLLREIDHPEVSS